MDASLRIAPSLKDGLADSFAVDPPFPPGMAIDASTGLIYGCPKLSDENAITFRKEKGPLERKLSFVISATNSAGTCSFSVTIQFSHGAWDLMLVQFRAEESDLHSAALESSSTADTKVEWENFHQRWNHEVLRLDSVGGITKTRDHSKQRRSVHVREEFTELQGLWQSRIAQDAHLNNQRAKLIESWGVKTFEGCKKVK
jgi:hypothetical protein